jgi:myo-inositol-1(or 4)-monophosphatase
MRDPGFSSEIDLKFLRDCLDGAGKMAYKQRGQMTADIKEDQTPVTEVDHQVEDFLIERILARYPDHQVLSEESGLRPMLHPDQATYSWVIDPIDGTRSFAAGLPIWGISIGVLRGDQPYAGGFYMPVTGDLYWGTTQQAYYQDKPLPRITSIDADNPLGFLAVPSDFHLNFHVTYARVRSFGSTAAHLAYTLTGAATGVLTLRIGLWDIAGLLPLIQAVGIEMTRLDGRPFQPSEMMDGRIIHEPLLTAHPSVIEILRKQIQA